MRRVISSFIKASCVKGGEYMTYSQSYKSQRWFRDDSEALQRVKERACFNDLSSVWECFCVCVCQILTCKATWVFASSQSDYQGKLWFPLVCQHFLESFCICRCLHVLLGGLYSSLQLQTYHLGTLGWCALKIFQGIYRYVKRSKEVWSPGRFSRMKSWESKV